MDTQPYSFFSVIQYLQFMLIIPLTGVEIHGAYEGWAKLSRDYLGGFRVISEVFDFDGYISEAHSPPPCQQNRYLYYLGLESGAAYENLLDLFFIFLVILLTSLVTLLIYSLTKQKYSEAWFTQITGYISKHMFFNAFIRGFALVCMYLWLVSASEIFINNREGEEGGSYAIGFKYRSYRALPRSLSSVHI